MEKRKLKDKFLKVGFETHQRFIIFLPDRLMLQLLQIRTLKTNIEIVVKVTNKLIHLYPQIKHKRDIVINKYPKQFISIPKNPIDDIIYARCNFLGKLKKINWGVK